MNSQALIESGRRNSTALACQREWGTFIKRGGSFLRERRGRISHAARFIGVRRQSLWRWFFGHGCHMPAWAVLPMMQWFYHETGKAPFVLVSPQADNLSGDPRKLLVSPQADNGLSPDPGTKRQTTAALQDASR